MCVFWLSLSAVVWIFRLLSVVYFQAASNAGGSSGYLFFSPLPVSIHFSFRDAGKKRWKRKNGRVDWSFFCLPPFPFDAGGSGRKKKKNGLEGEASAVPLGGRGGGGEWGKEVISCERGKGEQSGTVEAPLSLLLSRYKTPVLPWSSSRRQKREKSKDLRRKSFFFLLLFGQKLFCLSPSFLPVSPPRLPSQYSRLATGEEPVWKEVYIISYFALRRLVSLSEKGSRAGGFSLVCEKEGGKEGSLLLRGDERQITKGKKETGAKRDTNWRKKGRESKETYFLGKKSTLLRYSGKDVAFEKVRADPTLGCCCRWLVGGSGSATII